MIKTKTRAARVNGRRRSRRRLLRMTDIRRLRLFRNDVALYNFYSLCVKFRRRTGLHLRTIVVPPPPVGRYYCDIIIIIIIIIIVIIIVVAVDSFCNIACVCAPEKRDLIERASYSNVVVAGSRRARAV